MDECWLCSETATKFEDIFYLEIYTYVFLGKSSLGLYCISREAVIFCKYKFCKYSIFHFSIDSVYLKLFVFNFTLVNT